MHKTIEINIDFYGTCVSTFKYPVPHCLQVAVLYGITITQRLVEQIEHCFTRVKMKNNRKELESQHTFY